jgi:hypothetical protein
MLLWNGQTGDVLLKPWPERPGEKEHAGYSSTLACWLGCREATFEQRASLLLTEFAFLVVVYNIDPKKLHKVLLELPEWRSIRPDRAWHD